MDDTEEHRAREADVERTWRAALLWTAAVIATTWGLALLGWP